MLTNFEISQRNRIVTKDCVICYGFAQGRGPRTVYTRGREYPEEYINKIDVQMLAVS